MSRLQLETEKLKFGSMSAVFFHTERDAEGRLVSAWISCNPKHINKEFGDLMQAISERTQAAIDEARKL